MAFIYLCFNHACFKMYWINRFSAGHKIKFPRVEPAICPEGQTDASVDGWFVAVISNLKSNCCFLL